MADTNKCAFVHTCLSRSPTAQAPPISDKILHQCAAVTYVSLTHQHSCRRISMRNECACIPTLVEPDSARASAGVGATRGRGRKYLRPQINTDGSSANAPVCRASLGATISTLVFWTLVVFLRVFVRVFLAEENGWLLVRKQKDFWAVSFCFLTKDTAPRFTPVLTRLYGE